MEPLLSNITKSIKIRGEKQTKFIRKSEKEKKKKEINLKEVWRCENNRNSYGKCRIGKERKIKK